MLKKVYKVLEEHLSCFNYQFAGDGFNTIKPNILMHSGRTDYKKGHNVTANKTYHYHKGSNLSIWVWHSNNFKSNYEKLSTEIDIEVNLKNRGLGVSQHKAYKLYLGNGGVATKGDIYVVNKETFKVLCEELEVFHNVDLIGHNYYDVRAFFNNECVYKEEKGKISLQYEVLYKESKFLNNLYYSNSSSFKITLEMLNAFGFYKIHNNFYSYNRGVVSYQTHKKIAIIKDENYSGTNMLVYEKPDTYKFASNEIITNNYRNITTKDVDNINKILDYFEINTKEKVLGLFANLAHECTKGEYLVEVSNFNKTEARNDVREYFLNNHKYKYKFRVVEAYS